MLDGFVLKSGSFDCDLTQFSQGLLNDYSCIRCYDRKIRMKIDRIESTDVFTPLKG